MSQPLLPIKVVYVLPHTTWEKSFCVAENTTVEEALLLCESLPVDFMQHKIGIYGKVVSLQHQVQAGDRIEIYRPLKNDPMTARRLRADKTRKKKKRNYSTR